MAANVAPKTHLDIFDGQIEQVEIGTSFPTARQEAMYLIGVNDDGLDDGDIFYNTASDVLGIRIGGTWQYIEFTDTP
jgi:hypothetical protein